MSHRCETCGAPRWTSTIVNVAVFVMFTALALIVLAVYFESFRMVLFGGLLLFSALISFLSLSMASKPKDILGPK